MSHKKSKGSFQTFQRSYRKTLKLIFQSQETQPSFHNFFTVPWVLLSRDPSKAQGVARPIHPGKCRWCTSATKWVPGCWLFFAGCWLLCEKIYIPSALSIRCCEHILRLKDLHFSTVFVFENPRDWTPSSNRVWKTYPFSWGSCFVQPTVLKVIAMLWSISGHQRIKGLENFRKVHQLPKSL